jgi:hypothetical protein
VERCIVPAGIDRAVHPVVRDAPHDDREEYTCR